MLEQTAREAFQENQETGFGSVAKNSSRVILHRMHAEPGTGPPGGSAVAKRRSRLPLPQKSVRNPFRGR